MTQVSQSEFATRCGVKPPTIFRHVQPGGRLAGALIKRGKRKRINISHPAAREYMELHGADLSVELTPAGASDRETISQTAFARLCGIHRRSVYRAMSAPGHPLQSAAVVVGKRTRIDKNHVEAARFLFNRRSGVKPNGAGKVRRPRVRVESTATDDSALIDETITAELGQDAAAILARMKDENLPPDPTDFYGWSLRQVVGTFGASENFKKYLECVKLIEMIEKERAAVGIKKGELANRDVITATLWTPLEMLFQRLIGDTPRTLARQLIMKVKAGDPVETLEAVIRKRIGTELVNFKSKVDDQISGIDTGVE